MSSYRSSTAETLDSVERRFRRESLPATGNSSAIPTREQRMRGILAMTPAGDSRQQDDWVAIS